MWYCSKTKYSQHKTSFSDDANCNTVSMSKKDKEIVRECKDMAYDVHLNVWAYACAG